MENVRFAVIGHGNIGRRHVNFLKELDGAEIVYVCDVKRERADEGALSSGGAAVYDYEKVLSDGSVDVVDRCTPSGLHAEMAVQAITADRIVKVVKDQVMMTA
ncbi:MAG: Gfo/Idh/MocA family protein, partial [Thermoplasmatota archaeon]